MDQLQNQMAIAVAVVAIIQRLKLSNWASFVNPQTARILSALAAAGVSAGFTASHTGSFLDGGAITIGYPSLPTIVQFVIGALTQGGLQEFLYKGTIAQGEMGKTVVELQKQLSAIAATPPKILDPTKTGHLE